jgi:hypothetical protein
MLRGQPTDVCSMSYRLSFIHPGFTSTSAYIDLLDRLTRHRSLRWKQGLIQAPSPVTQHSLLRAARSADTDKDDAGAPRPGTWEVCYLPALGVGVNMRLASRS